jgi:hypothetical protein
MLYRKDTSVFKRISLLIAAALMAAMMMVATAAPAFADPNCRGQVGDNNQNCTKDGPGKSENSSGNAINSNPNVEVKFKDRPQ